MTLTITVIDRSVTKVKGEESYKSRTEIRVGASNVRRHSPIEMLAVKCGPEGWLVLDRMLKKLSSPDAMSLRKLLGTLSDADAVLKYYEAKTGKKAQSERKGSMVIVLKGASLRTAEQGIMILPGAPGSKSTMVLVMRSRPGKP